MSKSDDLSEFECFSDEVVDGAATVNEVDIYLGYSPPKKDFTLLQFWKSQETVLPKLAALARKVFGVPAGSSSSERLFRNAGNIFAVKRTSLSPEKLDNLLFLMWNKNPQIVYELIFVVKCCVSLSLAFALGLFSRSFA